ncbi:MAG TPA: hypothetical protein ENJ95_12395 [Bacteroidetes bacterium]|nr:hypothetical protein [Bacteroidota bacterium]
MKRLSVYLLIIFSFLFISTKTDAQRAIGWEVKWYIDGVQYSGLIYETNTPFLEMRVYFIRNGMKSIIQQSLARSSDAFYNYFIGNNVRPICTPPNLLYLPDSFRWTNWGRNIEVRDARGIWFQVFKWRAIYSLYDLNITGSNYQNGIPPCRC